MKETIPYKKKSENINDDRLRTWVLELHHEKTPIMEICRITGAAEYRVKMVLAFPKVKVFDYKDSEVVRHQKRLKKARELRNLEKELHDPAKRAAMKPGELESKCKLYALTIL